MRETLAIALLVFAAPAGAQEQKSPVQAPEPTQKIEVKAPCRCTVAVVPCRCVQPQTVQPQPVWAIYRGLFGYRAKPVVFAKPAPPPRPVVVPVRVIYRPIYQRVYVPVYPAYLR